MQSVRTKFVTCPGCGLSLPELGGPNHPYLGTTPECWALYGQVLMREYSDPEYMRIHRVTVDSYATQHPGSPERRTIQSINVHLVGLYLSIETDTAPKFIMRVIGVMTHWPKGRLKWLEVPQEKYALTVADVLCATDPNQHCILVRRWAEAVWHAWSIHHGYIRDLASVAMKVVETDKRWRR